MNKSIFVSVIIPVYNGEKYIAECIKSIYEQTYKKFEIIIIDDGSTDNSIEVIENIKNEEVRIISQKNGDVSKARNEGIKNASGDLIAFLDQDDKWLPEKLQKCVKIFNELEKVDLVFHDIIKLFSSGKTHRAKDKHNIALSLNNENIFQKLVVKNVLMPSAVMVRKESILKAGLFDTSFKTCGDYEMWLRMALLKMEFKYLPEALTIYRIHPNNNSNRIEVMFQDRLKALEVSFSNIKIDTADKKFRNKGLAAAYMQGANEFFSKKKYSEFLTNTNIALKLDKNNITGKMLSRYLRSLFFVKILRKDNA